MEKQDKLQNLYEGIVAKEHKDIEQKSPDIIESLIKRIETLENRVVLLEGK